MKKLLLLLPLIIVLVSCTAADSIVGKWQSTEPDGTVLCYEFRNDGTGSISNGKNEAEFSYVAEDGVLTVTYGGKTESADYTLDGDTLTLTDGQGTSVLTRTEN